MRTVLFVHGTGVREPAYTRSFDVVQQALTRRLGATRVRVEPCNWGDSCGSALFLGGASIPEFDTTRAAGDVGGDGLDYHLALWAMLYGDPFAELDLLALREPGAETPPGQEPPGADLDRRGRRLAAGRIEGLSPAAEQELAGLMTRGGVAEHFDEARGDVVAHSAYARALAAAMEPLTDYRLAVARAIVARCVQKGREGAAATASAVMLDGQCRDRIVELLVAALGGREASVADWVKEKAGRLVMAGGTRYFRRARGRLSDQFAPLGADVIAYQARPRPLREFIRDCVRKASAAAHARGESGDVAVIAHSLGGVATVDALIEQPLPAVSDLMTIGSQAPLLYELDALGSLPILRDVHGKVAPPPHPLPPHFPKAWLNVYDPRDFLSYRAAGVFGASCVQDEEIDTGQPFPESHSAYWTNDRVWDVIVDRLS